jgi:hypothetical protein
MKWLLALAAVCALTVSAADISGTWKGTAEGPMGKIERTFVFKVDGNKVTGETTSDVMGKSAIENGTIDGDTVTFDITVNAQGSDIKVHYTGKISTDDIKFHVEVPGQDYKTDYTAHRVS